MKVYMVDAAMRTPDDINFALNYFVFINRKKVHDQYMYTIKSGESTDTVELIDRSIQVVTTEIDSWEEVVMSHFDATIRAVNPNVDNVKIVEITL